MSYPGIRSAVRAERLFEVHRGIYSLVPAANLSVHARHYAAILAGGKGAALFDESATWWLQLTRSMPQLIHIAVRSAKPPVAGVRWHIARLREGETEVHNRMRVTSPARTALDYAATHSLWETKAVLAELEYRYRIEAADLIPILRRGHPGSRRLRHAVAEHTPQLAKSHEHAERMFLRFLNEQLLELPEAQVRYGPTHVDFAYPRLNLIVEIDGIRGHGTERRVRNDHKRDLHRRTEGKRVLRYHHSQMVPQSALLKADLKAHGVREVAADRRSGQSRK